jgi:hypothetical protein
MVEVLVSAITDGWEMTRLTARKRHGEDLSVRLGQSPSAVAGLAKEAGKEVFLILYATA